LEVSSERGIMVEACKCKYPKHHPKDSRAYYSKFQTEKLLEGWIRMYVALNQCNFPEVNGAALVYIS